jgi:hypothetical protein
LGQLTDRRWAIAHYRQNLRDSGHRQQPTKPEEEREEAGGVVGNELGGLTYNFIIL